MRHFRNCFFICFLEGGLQFVGRGRQGHVSLIFLNLCLILIDLHELLMGNIVLHGISKRFLEFDFILLVDLFLEVFGLVLVDEVVIGVPEVHN